MVPCVFGLAVTMFACSAVQFAKPSGTGAAGSPAHGPLPVLIGINAALLVGVAAVLAEKSAEKSAEKRD